MAVATGKEDDEPGRNYQVSTRKAEGKGRDSLKFVGDYNFLDERTGGELLEETDNSVYDRQLENGVIRLISSGERATLHFFPSEELTDEETVYGLENSDAKPRKKYKEELEPLYELAGGEEELGRLLEELQ